MPLRRISDIKIQIILWFIELPIELTYGTAQKRKVGPSGLTKG